MRATTGTNTGTGTKPPSDDEARALEQVQLQFQASADPFLPWVAYAFCRPRRLEVPSWVLEAFDGTAARLQQSLRARLDPTTRHPFKWAEIGRIFGCGRTSPFAAYRRFVLRWHMAVHKRLNREAGDRRANETTAEAVCDLVPGGGIDVKSIERAWTCYRGFVQADDLDRQRTQRSQSERFLRAFKP